MNEVNRKIFSGMRILSGNKWENEKALVIEDNIIKAIITTDMIKHHLPATQYEFSAECYLTAGFIDLHVHGAKGADVMDEDAESLRTISRALAEEGITGFLATTMTASDESIEKALENVANSMGNVDGAAILGVHLEGPFIAKSKAGAQLADETQNPNLDLFNHWQKVAKDAIKLVTLAPELPDALNLIKALRETQVVASIGHTKATYDETEAAINAGCSHATHLFNAMSGIHQREPGASVALLLSDKITAELIVDNYHLHPAMIELAFKTKGKDRLVLITDAMRAKCLQNGTYDLGGQAVNVLHGKATLEDGTLAGSTLQMNEAIKNITKTTTVSLIDAITMAASNPARVLSLPRKGVIEVGFDADLVVLNDKLKVLLTMRDGRVIYEAKEAK